MLADVCTVRFTLLRTGECCPEGALLDRYSGALYFSRFPDPGSLNVWCNRNGISTTMKQHADFQTAWDYGIDRGSDESALGLVYRERFGRNRS